MPRAFELRTDRLTVRPLGRDDITAFTRYRNDGEVARFQDWPLPYTRDHAHHLIDDVERLGAPTSGEWVQLAIDHAGQFVGDLAVWLDDDGEVAMVGYTIAREHHGHGFAGEAVGALVEWLFVRRRVHRIAATIDPRNLASARVLEQHGFEHEGTARSAALVRGEWTDDARFSLLADDWRAWRRRPTGKPAQVDLVELTRDRLRAVGELEVAFYQQKFVAPVLVSLAEALVPPVEDGETVRPWYRAVVADDEVVGFVMLAEPGVALPHPYLWRFLVGRRHQGRGIGRRVVDQLARTWTDAGATHLYVSWVPDLPGNPGAFYRSLGFEPTGKIDDGEVEAVRVLDRDPR